MSDGTTPGQGEFGPPGSKPSHGESAGSGNPYVSPPGAEGGYGYPNAGVSGPSYGSGGGHAQQLVSIGDIVVTDEGIVTPAGQLPLSGAIWTITDMSRTEEKIPPQAIVLACVFIVFCFLRLLFLLMKQRSTTGHVQVTVNSGGKFHSTMIPVNDPAAVHYIMQQVNYARSVSM